MRTSIFKDYVQTSNKVTLGRVGSRNINCIMFKSIPSANLSHLGFPNHKYGLTSA